MYLSGWWSCRAKLAWMTGLCALGLFVAGASPVAVRAQSATPLTDSAEPSDAESTDDGSVGDLALETGAIGTAALYDDEGPLDDKFQAGLAARLADVEKELKALKKKGEADKKTTKPEEIWTDTSTEKWTVKLGGHVQMDYINWAHADESIAEKAPAPGPKNYFEFRRVRLVAEGTGYGVYDFRLQMTLEPEAISDTAGAQTLPTIKDAYFSINEIPWLGRLRIGNFFVPFSLEQVTNDTNNIFMERSIPTQGVFAANREVGVASYNCTADQRITWSTGIFLDSISESAQQRIDNNQGYRISGRATWLPYYDEPSNGRYLVHTGAGVLYTNDQDNNVRFRSRPQIHLGPNIIDSGALNANSFTTGNLEAAVVWGPVTIQSEAFLSTVDMNTGEPINLSGAYLHGSYFLTGENRIYERFGQHGAQFARNVPYSNVFFIPGAFSLGAVELKARWSNLNLNNFNKGQYNDFTAGFNWYWSDRTRIMFDWIHPITSSDAIYGQTQSDILAMRFDFNW